MKKRKQNGIATAADFKALAEAEAFGQAERVTLPHSGLAVMLRRPRAQAFVLGRASLPQTLAAVLLKADPGAPPTPEEAIASDRFWFWMFTRMFESPRLSLEPGEDEIHPGLIPLRDQEFLFGWARGEVAPDGSDLRKFRGRKSGRGLDAGQDGADAGRKDAQRDTKRTDA